MQPNNEVGGHIYSSLGLIYGVLLGFIVLFVFEDYTRAKLHVDKEAGALVDLYRVTRGYPPGSRELLQKEILSYARTVFRAETLSANEEEIHALWRRYLEFSPDGLKTEVVHQRSLEHLANLGDARRLRLLSAHTNIPGFMWFVLVLGGVVLVSFSFLFGARNVRTHAMMSGLLAAMISITLLLIFHLDHVYDGKLAIGREAYEMALRQLEKPDA